MVTPRKPKSTTPLRSRVVIPRLGRRPAGEAVAVAITARVRAIIARVGVVGPDASRVLKLTSRRFSYAIGISEKALELRLRTKNPTPFNAEELASICRVFDVRSEYLLLGEGPMLHGEVVEANWEAPRRLSNLLHEHLVAVIASQSDQDAAWVQSFLPRADDLLLAVESGAVDSVSSATEDLVSDRRLAIDAVRTGVMSHLRARTHLPDSPPEFFSEATGAVLDGTVVGPQQAQRQGRHG